MSPTNRNDRLAPEWDELLGDGLVRPPADFQASVMQRVKQEPNDTNASPSLIHSFGALLQAAAVLIGAIAAGWQTLAFVFSLWATAVAI